MPADVRTQSPGGTRGPGTWGSASPWRSSTSWPWSPSPRLRGEGHAEEFQQSPGLFVGLRRRNDGDLQPAETVYFVVIDLGERHLLLDPDGVVAAPVERTPRDAPEVADTRQRQEREPLEEVPHSLAAQRDLEADWIARPHAELGDRALGARHDRLLARDLRPGLGSRVDGLGVGQRLSQPDVHDDLLKSRDLHRVDVAELLLQRRDSVCLVAIPEIAGDHVVTSRALPQ